MIDERRQSSASIKHSSSLLVREEKLFLSPIIKMRMICSASTARVGMRKKLGREFDPPPILLAVQNSKENQGKEVKSFIQPLRLPLLAAFIRRVP